MKKALIALWIAVCSMTVFGQSFQNLGFESANVSNPDSLHSVSFSSAFPNWQAIAGGTYPSLGINSLTLGPVGHAYYNTSDLDQMTIGVYDLNPLLGTYTAWVEADLGSMHSGALQLFQTGLVPASARSLRFLTTSYSSLSGFSEQLSLQINGATIPIVPTLIQSASTSWAADISPYANTLSEVRFVFRADYPFAGGDPHVFFGIGLDGISFSPVPVPEPGFVSLILLGLAVVRAKLNR